MKKILFIIEDSLPRKFTRKQFNIAIRKYSDTTHPEHLLQRIVEKGRIKHTGDKTYQLV